MKKILAIVAGEPNSISSEIIFKTWKLRKKFKHNYFFVIGSIEILKKQSKKLKYNIKFKELKSNFHTSNLDDNFLNIYNINYSQKKPFQNISNKSNKYIKTSFETALNFIKNKKICGLVNCPISKEHLLKKKFRGITEFLANKSGSSGNEVMLIYNKKLSVSPITTHIPLKNVTRSINKIDIIKKVKTINLFYKQKFKKNPIIGILGINPHNYSPYRNSEEKSIILPAIKVLKKNKIKVVGPFSTDAAFLLYKKYNLDVIVGMYHDQVLTTFKSLFKYDAINITLGLPFIRTTPDHGTAEDIMGKNLANPKSLIESLKFFNNIK